MNMQPRALAALVALLVSLVYIAVNEAQEQGKTAAVQKELQQRFGERVDIRFDQPYAGTDNPRQRLDIYIPKHPKSDQPLPVVVYIHGGGWSGGNRIGSASAAVQQASSGNYAAISVGYRLSGEVKWPAQIHDCKAAIRWIRAHAKELNLDPDHIGCLGGSAGGHLVTLLGVTNETKELDGDVGEYTNQSSRVQCVVNVCGPSDLTAPLGPNEAKDYTNPLIVALIGGSTETKLAAAQAASPLTHVSAKSAPIMSIHGTHDTTVSFAHSERLDAALKKAGATSLLIPIVNAGHNVPFPSELTNRLTKFWDMYLRGISSEISTEPIVVPAPPVVPKK